MVDVSSTDQRVVKEIIAEKHPPASPALADFIVDANPQAAHPAVFNDLDARCITVAALHTKGAAGPSGVDGGSCVVLLAQRQRSYTRLWHLQLGVYAPLWLIPNAFQL